MLTLRLYSLVTHGFGSPFFVHVQTVSISFLSEGKYGYSSNWRQTKIYLMQKIGIHFLIFKENTENENRFLAKS